MLQINFRLSNVDANISLGYMGTQTVKMKPESSDFSSFCMFYIHFSYIPLGKSVVKVHLSQLKQLHGSIKDLFLASSIHDFRS